MKTQTTEEKADMNARAIELRMLGDELRRFEYLDAPTVIRKAEPDILGAIDDFILSWSDVARRAYIDALRTIEAGIRRLTP